MFPESLKLADVTPLYKKSDPTLVSNYRPISVSEADSEGGAFFSNDMFTL